MHSFNRRTSSNKLRFTLFKTCASDQQSHDSQEHLWILYEFVLPESALLKHVHNIRTKAGFQNSPSSIALTPSSQVHWRLSARLTRERIYLHTIASVLYSNPLVTDTPNFHKLGLFIFVKPYTQLSLPNSPLSYDDSISSTRVPIFYTVITHQQSSTNS